MLTKTLNFDNDVLEVIRAMAWHDDGKLGVLTCGQLNRELYLRVNEAFAALGGKWNRKKGGHVFLTDPRQRVTGLVENGMLTVTRDGFFETPVAVVERMVELMYPVGSILEPSAGLGAIADNLPVRKEQVVCVEKNKQRAEVLRQKGYAVQCRDFLKYDVSGKFDTIFMNPPFEEGQDVVHVRHAYNCLVYGGTMVSVVSEGPFFRNDYRARAFREWLEQVGGESHLLPPGSFRESGTRVHARLVVIRRLPEAMAVNEMNEGQMRMVL